MVVEDEAAEFSVGKADKESAVATRGFLIKVVEVKSLNSRCHRISSAISRQNSAIS